MDNLPSERVNISSPFTIAGLDLCGPFLVKYKNQRKGTLNKVYICVCICFSTKAIHLELLSDLTSDAALIATLKHFTSRRAKYFVSENIDWKFILPKSPHFRGLWEAGVKSVKHHLKRAIGNLHLSFEEFETMRIQVEGILNPLTPLSSDADNFDVLTPGHFLIGRPITSIPEPNLIDANENRLSRWEKITKVAQRTWKKWKSDYLNTLQARSKWITGKNNLMIGQMVLIKEDFLPINTWPLGRISEVYHGSDGKPSKIPMEWTLGRIEGIHPGSDGLVRVIRIRTSRGVFTRTAASVCPLPFEDVGPASNGGRDVPACQHQN
ncbi:integrase catalytic domain-containing protein [Trichonephila clavipes]|nr:integrase catalytic domain-containing protein [Trichonephila clavipes]